MADGVDQVARAVEIDAIALVELGFRLARHDRGEMEDHLRPVRDERRGRTGVRKIGGHDLDRDRCVGRLCRFDHVLQRHAGDLVLAETPVAQKPVGQFAADHAGRPEDQNVQDLLLVIA